MPVRNNTNQQAHNALIELNNRKSVLALCNLSRYHITTHSSRVYHSTYIYLYMPMYMHIDRARFCTVEGPSWALLSAANVLTMDSAMLPRAAQALYRHSTPMLLARALVHCWCCTALNSLPEVRSLVLRSIFFLCWT